MSTQPIVIGFLLLDESYSPFVTLSFEYFKTEGEEIIGGLQKYVIDGNVTVSDADGVVTGSIVMSKLKSIRALGKKTKCVDVIIPGFYSGQAKLTNVIIEQGSDPSWINQGQFKIELSAPLLSIPTNSLGITVSDYITEISKKETIEIGEDAHGYVLVGTSLSKAFVKFTNNITLTCKPLCPSLGGDQANGINVLRRIASNGPTHKIFEKYKNWQPHLQGRSLQLSTDGSLSFNSEVILLPPNITSKAFIDIDFEHTRAYEPKTHNKKISGTITGLASIGWTDIISLSNSVSSSKFANAEAVFNTIKPTLVSLDDWDGITLELKQLPNCPTQVNECSSSIIDNNIPCYKPISSAISKSRTEGQVSFTYEWATDCEESNGKRTEITIDITEPQEQFVEHIVPDVGTLIQNLNCRSAKVLEITSSTTDPRGEGCSTTNECSATDALNKALLEYIDNESQDWLLIEHSRTTTSDSFSIRQKYIQGC